MIARHAIAFLDRRLGSSAFIKAALRKVFPDHWSFMLGEICVYTFLILLVTGTYIAFHFSATDTPVIYHGSYAPLNGRSVPASFASVLALSFATPLGLLIRQMHHWAANIFIAAIVLHMCRIFFTGAFRKPRELNWAMGITLLLLALGAGFSGYSLPGDLLSGVGLRVAYSVALAVPVVGTWLAFLFFGGPYPTHEMTQRLFIVHVWILPAVILGAISLHLGMVWRQHHTQFREPQRTEENVVGSRIWPFYAMKSLALLAITFASITILGGLVTINPVWLYGPYDPWNVASPSQPDWYVAWLDGALRISPPLALHLLGYTLSPVFWPGVLLPAVLFGILYLCPLIERRITRDDRAHNLLDMPYDNPWRLGIGITFIAEILVLVAAGSDDIEAKFWHVPVETLMYTYRMLTLLVPVICGCIAVVLGFELKRRSAAVSQPTQRISIYRNADGGFEEGPVTDEVP